MVTIDPVGGDAVEISLDSSVEKAFGDRIREVIAETLKNLGVTGREGHGRRQGRAGLHGPGSHHRGGLSRRGHGRPS